jgi:putative phosphoribosyl transferase
VISFRMTSEARGFAIDKNEGNSRVFQDRREAGNLLAKKLEAAYGRNVLKNAVILAIPRGGVVTGDALVRRFGTKLDVLVSKKVCAPGNPELAAGAVMHDGSFFPNKDVIIMLNISPEYLKEQIVEKMKEVERRLLKFRGSKSYHLGGKFVVLADDGIATGATVFAALNWLKSQNAEKIVVAVPVGPVDTIAKLRTVADDVVVLQTPRVFGAVGEFYRDFAQVTDDEVVEIMSRYPRDDPKELELHGSNDTG